MIKAGISTDPNAKQIAARPAIRFWLFCMTFLVFAMVIVGGATRLTDSGLSITEWKPLMGALPPLSDADWQDAFKKYQQIPEYKLINKWMDLEAFKSIYWWEWGHRFLGRFIGLAFFVPLAFFWTTGRLERALKMPLAVIFVLGGLQGVMGWYMVMSGLAERVDVSQYRLAAHLSLAAVIFSYQFWTAMQIGSAQSRPPWTRARAALILCALILVQIVLGAFVAGIDAGKGYNTWPLMDGSVIPYGLFAIEPMWLNFFENALTVQFTHRVFAYLVLLFGLFLIVRCLKEDGESPVRLSAGVLGLVLLAQVGLGIWVLLAGVPLFLGLLHQGGAMVLLAAGLWHVHEHVHAGAQVKQV